MAADANQLIGRSSIGTEVESTRRFLNAIVTRQLPLGACRQASAQCAQLY